MRKAMDNLTVNSSTNLKWAGAMIVVIASLVVAERILQAASEPWVASYTASLGLLVFSIVVGQLSFLYELVRTRRLPDLYLYLTRVGSYENNFKRRLARGFWPCIIAGIANCLGIFLIFESVRVDSETAVFQAGALTLLLLLVPLCVLFLSWWAFREQYSIPKIIGILAIVVGSELLCSRWVFSLGESLSGLCGLFFFTVRGVLNKYAVSSEFNYNIAGVLICTCDALTGVVIAGIFCAVKAELALAPIGLSILCGSLLGLASYFLSVALKLGNSGVTYAMLSIKIMLNQTEFSTASTTVKLISGGLCLVGAIIALCGDYVVAAFRQNRREPLNDPLI